jgi:hypothetical protein
MIFTASWLIIAVNFLLLIMVSFMKTESSHAYLPFLFIFFSFPHFMATYGVWISRVKSWKEEWWPLTFPFLYLAFFYFSTTGQLKVIHPAYLVKLTYFYLLYHFCGQLYGVALWMGTEKKVLLALWEKRILRSCFLLMGAFSLMDLELRGATGILFYANTPMTIAPAWLMQGTFLSFIILSLIFCALTFRNFFVSKNIASFLPLMILGLGFVWFIPPFSHDLVYFLPILHGLQYYPFIFLKFKGFKAWQWALFISVCMGAGYVLFRVLPFWESGLNSLGVLWTAMILTFFNNHHFIIDGRIWKLSDPKNADLFTSYQELRSPEVRVPL